MLERYKFIFIKDYKLIDTPLLDKGKSESSELSMPDHKVSKNIQIFIRGFTASYLTSV